MDNVEQVPVEPPAHRLPRGQVQARRERRAKPSGEERPQARPPRQDSRPRMDREIRLNTERAQHIFNRQWRVTNRALHYLTADLPSILYATQKFNTLDAQQLFNNVSDKIAEIFGRVSDAFDTEAARLQVICDEHGLSIPDYTVPVVTEAQVSSRSANQLVELFARLDEILMLLDAVWIAGLHGDREHNAARRHFYKALYRLTNQVADVALRARSCFRKRTVELFPEDEQQPVEDEDHPEVHSQEFDLEDGERAMLAQAANA